uniref:Uncharacterized protein n=1 Tax=Anguilla anguilla TaxID=7936 RepID=A0A0E9X5I7_ANGAN
MPHLNCKSIFSFDFSVIKQQSAICIPVCEDRTGVNASCKCKLYPMMLCGVMTQARKQAAVCSEQHNSSKAQCDAFFHTTKAWAPSTHTKPNRLHSSLVLNSELATRY